MRKSKYHSFASILDSVPTSEEQWQHSRAAHGLDTAEKILGKVIQLRDLDLSGNTAAKLDTWQELVIIAVAVVDLSNGKDPTQMLATIYGHPPSQSTRRQDKGAILRLLRFLDELYPCLEHRAFELLIILGKLVSPLRGVPLTYYIRYLSTTSSFDHWPGIPTAKNGIAVCISA